MNTVFVLGLEACFIPDTFCKVVAKCRDDSGASSDMVKSVIFNQRGNVDSLTKRMIKQRFFECINGSVPFEETVEAINRLKALDVDIFISSGLPLKCIEGFLSQFDFTMVFGREDGSSPEHIDTIYRIYEPEKLFFVSGKPQHFIGVNRAQKICVNTRSKVDGADMVIPGPFSKEIVEWIIKEA